MAQEYYNITHTGEEIDESVVNTNTNIINIGDPINLTTTDKTNLVEAINEVTTKTENNIATTDKTNLVEEISDNTIKISDNTNSIELIDTKVNTNQTSIGTLVSLNTIDKSSLVNAINEVSISDESEVGSDFVIEHGGDNDSGYEKWNSGFFQMWGTTTRMIPYLEFEQIGTTGIYYMRDVMMVAYVGIETVSIPNVVVNESTDSGVCWADGGCYVYDFYSSPPTFKIWENIFKLGTEKMTLTGSYVATGRWK